jgi:hypothetical protein
MNAKLTILPRTESLVALLALRAGLSHLPAATWPLEGALEMLRGRADESGVLCAALEQLPQRPLGPEERVAGVGQLVRELVATGRLMPEGTGWDARFRLSRAWLESHRELYVLLSADDRAALDRAGQQLVAMTTMLSKNAAA